MTARNFPACLAFTLHEEGGYQSNPDDPGNWWSGVLVGTNFGISAPTLAAHIGRNPTPTDMQHLSTATAAEIYRADYWTKINGDDWPQGLDLMGFDHAALSGPARSLQALVDSRTARVGAKAAYLSAPRAARLQRVLGVEADGQIGPVTSAALTASTLGQRALDILYVAEFQEVFYRQRQNFPTFGAGWLARLGRRTDTALKMMGGSDA